MRLKFVGVGAGFSSGLGNNNVMLYDKNPEDGYYLIDCGETTRTRLVEDDLIDQLKGVIITHIHGDHIFGLEMLGFWWKFVKKERLKIFVPTVSLVEDIWKTFEPSMSQIQDKDGNALKVGSDEFFEFIICDHVPIKFDSGTLHAFFHESDHVPGKESYGVSLITKDKAHYFTSDQRTPVKKPAIDGYVWQDCQLYDGGKTAVHAYFRDILETYKDDEDAAARVHLMHYNREPTDEELFDGAVHSGGFVEVGQEFDL